MSKENNLKKNFLYNVAYQILTVITPLITSPYVSRVLGAYNLGVYNYTYSVADYFILFAMLGVKNYGNRQISTVRDDKNKLSSTFINIYAFQIITSVAMIILYFGYIVLFNADNRLIAFIQGLYVLTALADISWFFYGMEEFKLTVTRNTVIKLVSTVCIFVFVRKREDLWVYTLILSSSMLAGYISIFPFLRRYIHFVKPDFSEIKRHIRPNLMLFIPVIAVSIFNVMDKVMLGWLSDYVQVGLYSNTEKLMRIPLGVITALGTVMMPHMSHMIATGKVEKSKEIIEQSMIFIMCMGCALACGLAGIGRVFAPVFFGEEFVECGTLIIVLSPTVLSLSWANVIRMQYLIPNKMDTQFTISTIIGAIVNLIVNSLLIPSYGALGAIIGTVCAETSVTVYQTYVVRKFLPIKRFLGETLPFLLIGMGMFILVNFVGNALGGGILTLIIQIFIGAIFYLALVFIYLSLSGRKQIHDFRAMALSLITSNLKKVFKR